MMMLIKYVLAIVLPALLLTGCATPGYICDLHTTGSPCTSQWTAYRATLSSPVNPKTT